MRKQIMMRDALTSPAYFGGPDMLGDDSWAAWRTILIAAMGEALTPDERVVYHQLTGLDKEPGKPVGELWGIVGRRGGKSRAIAVLASFLAGCVDYRHVLAPGQWGSIPIMAASREQAQEIFNYISGAFQTAPGLRDLVESVGADSISLKSRVEIKVTTASYKRARGFTAIAVIGDEVAFWSSENSANPDLEIIRAVRPALMTTGGPMVMISSPYARRGQIYEAWPRSYGKDDRPHVLIIQAASKTMNPSLPQEDIDQAYEEDPESAKAEYGAQFRSDIASFIDREVVQSAVFEGTRELPPRQGVTYRCFVDPAGGSGQDAMTLAIGHREGDVCHLDLLMAAQPPFSPESVVAEFVAACRRYGVRAVRADKWGGMFVAQSFTSLGIDYEPSAAAKSDIYRDLLPLLNSGHAMILDGP